MNAIDLLMDEHQIIVSALAALEAFADEVRAGSQDKAELGRFVRFIREFADTRHHGKEEDILFVAMVAAGFPREAGPIAVMLSDHEAGRAQTRRMAELAGRAAPWGDDDRAAVVAAARGYASMLRSHIDKENGILYPMGRRRLSAEAMAKVDADCAAFDERQGPAEELLGLARALAARHPGIAA